MSEHDGETSGYLVQREMVPGEWQDVAEVALPKRAHRQRAILMALRKAERDGEDGDRFRILDADAARVYMLRPRPRPLEEEFEVVTEEQP
jgi:hypothetical protein